MLFWEKTTEGLVVYPDWLDKIFTNPYLKILLPIVMMILSVIALIINLHFLFKHYQDIFNIQSSHNQQAFIIFYIIFLIIIFISLYSFFFILKRYVCTLIPLYLTLIAFGINQVKVEKQ